MLCTIYFEQKYMAVSNSIGRIKARGGKMPWAFIGAPGGAPLPIDVQPLWVYERWNWMVVAADRKVFYA